MNLEQQKKRILYELLPCGKLEGKKGILLTGRKLMIGRSESCDVVLPFSEISAIHAVIEIGQGTYKLYDMNSVNGSYVNGKKIIATDFQLGDVLKFGRLEFQFKRFKKQEVLPPVLDVLDPVLPPATERMIKKKKKKSLPFARLPKAPPTSKLPDFDRLEDEEMVPAIEYPLAQDPKAEFSEYIFEDSEDIYPIFKYDAKRAAVEVIILFQDKIYSVDYLPLTNGKYRLVGHSPTEREIEYARLAKKDRFDFIEVRGGDVTVIPLSGYEVLFLTDDTAKANAKESKQVNGPLILSNNDILRLFSGDIQIFVRRTDSPPKVKPAPFFRRDKHLKKYFALMMVLTFSFLVAMQVFQVDKEKEKEKNPERIAKILYKKKPIPKPTPTPIPKKPVEKPEPKKEQKLAAQPTPQPTPPKPVEKVAGQKETPPKAKAKKAEPKKGPEDVKSPVVTKEPPKKADKPKVAAPSQPAKTQATNVVKKAQGRVDTYKSADFSSTVSSLLAKSSGAKSVKKAQASISDGSFSSVDVGGKSATLKTAGVSQDVGSLAGVASGTLDTQRGTEGLVNKKQVYTVGMPSDTVILGSMDPSIIRQILMDHIPQFRHCYQRVLDKSAGSFDGVVPLDFTIGSSGHVTHAGLSGSPNMPGDVKRCIINVLQGMKFPKPLGGGQVGVKQPLNFYPRNV